MHASKSFPGRLILGLILLTAASLFGGAVLGALMFLASLVIYLIFLFPIGLGLVGGGTTGKLITRWKIHWPALGIFFGTLIGLISYGSYHYAGSIYLQQQGVQYARQELEPELGPLTYQQASAIVDVMMEETTGRKGMLAYFAIMAEEGVSIGHLFGGDFLTLPPALSCLYWFLELGLVAGMAGFTAAGAARKPFCEKCDQWYPDRSHIGALQGERIQEVLKLLDQRDFTRLGMILEGDAGLPSVDLYLEGCPTCDSHSTVLTAEQTALDQQQEIQCEVLKVVKMAPAERTRLTEALKHGL